MGMAMNKSWPVDGLEIIRSCPSCGSDERVRMYCDLEDLAFGIAPGQWTLDRCSDCGCGYLNPRPTQATIEIAYLGYYTHKQVGEEGGSFLARLRRGVTVSYANREIGTRFPGEAPAKHLVAKFFPRLRGYLDVRYRRHLPLPCGPSRRLLDVGCGNGEFLACAKAMGWDAEGIDVDPDAVTIAESTGCQVRQTDIEDPLLDSGNYAHITLNHVIEHLPNPLKHLRRCWELLEPGGRLWLQTPNIDSLGHSVFGKAWRGLEPPRHLVLFSQSGLTRLLQEAGFVDIGFKSHPGVALFIWEESLRMLRNLAVEEWAEPRFRLLRWLGGAIIADYWSVIRPNHAEFLTCTAFRPE